MLQEKLKEPSNIDGFTENGKKALELAIEEAGSLTGVAIRSEHLLLGLLKCEGMAAGVLVTRGLTVEKASAEIMRLPGR